MRNGKQKLPTTVLIRRDCAGRNSAHLMPDSHRLPEEDWIVVPYAELARGYRVLCTKCDLTFCITLKDAHDQASTMLICGESG